MDRGSQVSERVFIDKAENAAQISTASSSMVDIGTDNYTSKKQQHKLTQAKSAKHSRSSQVEDLSPKLKEKATRMPQQFLTLVCYNCVVLEISIQYSSDTAGVDSDTAVVVPTSQVGKNFLDINLDSIRKKMEWLSSFRKVCIEM